MAEFKRQGHTGSWRDYVATFADAGFVYATPTFFVMGRPVSSKMPAHEMRNLGITPAPQDVDTWFFAWFSGDMADVWRIMPRPLTYIAWERLRGEELDLQIAPMEVMHRLTLSSNGQSS